MNRADGVAKSVGCDQLFGSVIWIVPSPPCGLGGAEVWRHVAGVAGNASAVQAELVRLDRSVSLEVWQREMEKESDGATCVLDIVGE